MDAVLKTRVLLQMGDPDGNRYLDPELDAWFDEGARLLIAEIPRALVGDPSIIIQTLPGTLALADVQSEFHGALLDYVCARCFQGDGDDSDLNRAQTHMQLFNIQLKKDRDEG